MDLGTLTKDLDARFDTDDHRTAIEEYTKRLTGVVSPAFRNKTILTIGVGAGSYAVEKLVRLCPARVKNCDMDIVEVPNLARTAYSMEDARAGRLKVEALERRIREINPFVEVDSYSKSLTEMTTDELDELFEGVDLVVAGTDSFEAQALINEAAVERSIPAVFIGIHARSESARIVWCVPGETGCYRCVAPERYEAARTVDRARLNLDGMVGSLVDCQFIDMVALKVCVAILERGEDSQMGRFYERMYGRNDVGVRCDPTEGWGNALWDAVLSDLPKHPQDYAEELKAQVLLAMDAIWLRGRHDPKCPVCGR